MKLSKLAEREMWAALAPFIIGILTVLGVVGPEDGEQVAGIILMVGPTLGYIIMRIWQKVALARAEANVKIAEAHAEAQIKTEQAKAQASVKIEQAKASAPSA